MKRLVLTVLLLSLSASASTWTVKKSGGDFSTINACTAAKINTGDTCVVYATDHLGTTRYEESVTATGVSVTVNPSDACPAASVDANSIPVAPTCYVSIPAITATGSNVTISGFEVVAGALGVNTTIAAGDTGTGTSVVVTSSTGFVVGGTIINGAENATKVTVTAIPDGTHLTVSGSFTRSVGDTIYGTLPSSNACGITITGTGSGDQIINNYVHSASSSLPSGAQFSVCMGINSAGNVPVNAVVRGNTIMWGALIPPLAYSGTCDPSKTDCGQGQGGIFVQANGALVTQNAIAYSTTAVQPHGSHIYVVDNWDGPTVGSQSLPADSNSLFPQTAFGLSANMPSSSQALHIDFLGGSCAASSNPPTTDLLVEGNITHDLYGTSVEAGGSITKIAAGDAGSGNVLTVASVSGFTANSTYVSVGGNGTNALPTNWTALVTAVDSTAKTITLGPSSFPGGTYPRAYGVGTYVSGVNTTVSSSDTGSGNSLIVNSVPSTFAKNAYISVGVRSGVGGAGFSNPTGWQAQITNVSGTTLTLGPSSSGSYPRSAGDSIVVVAFNSKQAIIQMPVGTACDTTGHYVFRYNTPVRLSSYDLIPGAASTYSSRDTYEYNNTVANMQMGGSLSTNGVRVFTGWSGGGTAVVNGTQKNNLYYNGVHRNTVEWWSKTGLASFASDYNHAYLDTFFCGGTTSCAYNFIVSTGGILYNAANNPFDQHSLLSNTTGCSGAICYPPGLTTAPSFSPNTPFDLHISSTSADKGAGTALTTVAGTDTGTGTSLIVNDAKYFFDGTGNGGTALTNADCVSVTTSTNKSCITGVNYSTNTITLTSSITRSVGDPVYLASRTDGSNTMPGSSVDIGALPYTAPQAPSTVTIHASGNGSSTASGYCTTSAGVCDGNTTITYNGATATCVAGTPGADNLSCHESVANSTAISASVTSAAGSIIPSASCSAPNGSCSCTQNSSTNWTCSGNVGTGNLDIDAAFVTTPTATISAVPLSCNVLQNSCSVVITVTTTNLNVSGAGWQVQEATGSVITDTVTGLPAQCNYGTVNTLCGDGAHPSGTFTIHATIAGSLLELAQESATIYAAANGVPATCTPISCQVPLGQYGGRFAGAGQVNGLVNH